MQADTLLSWLADHLLSLCSQAQLGIVCSGLALELWQIAPAQLDPSERVELLLEHLGHTKLAWEFAAGLLRDETLRDEATRRGLAELVTVPASASGARPPALDAPLLTGQLDAALVTTDGEWPVDRDMLPGLWLRQAQLHRLAGRLKLAQALTAKAQALSPDLSVQAAAAAEHALLALLSGDAPLCLLHLRLSRSLLREAGQSVEPWPLRLAILQASRALRMQDVTEARKWLQGCAARAEQSQDTLAAAETAVLLADALRRDGEHEAAAQAIAQAIRLGNHSGAAEVLVAAGREQARLQMDLTNYEAAAAALGAALALAEELSLQCYRIDLLNLRGQLQLRRSNPMSAEQDARDALAHAMARECGYQWGEADSLHLLAVTLLSNRPRVQSLRHTEAITHLSDELELRDRMQDPTAPEVRWLIRRLRTVA